LIHRLIACIDDMQDVVSTASIGLLNHISHLIQLASAT
jgi:hypothetical protein